MDKKWMELNRLGHSFREGVEEFIRFAYSNKEPHEKIPCPCYKCNNFCDQTQEVVRYHLPIYGIQRSYVRWVYHGESHEDDLNNDRNIEDYNEKNESDDDESDYGDGDDESDYGDGDDESDEHNESDNDDDNDMWEMINDISNANLVNNLDSDDDLTNPGAPFPLGRADTFTKLLKDTELNLYKGCESYSKLSFLVKLLHIKTMSGWTNKSFDMLIELLKDAFKGVDLDVPKSYYESKKLMRGLGFTYKKIHSCPNDCVLFQYEHEHLDECPKCKTCRWKHRESKKIPQKVLRYFPLKPRLERLFVNKDLAENMRWHKEKIVHEHNILRHPADSEVWKDFDRKHPSFAHDPRNVRLGLASDGFSPFANMGTSYSIWPVILVLYNLPPWMCMKDPFFLLSMLIPGPKGPGNDIDVYLRPLIDELKELWGVGIEVYDAYKEENFILRAALMWTISDLPAFSYLSGWTTSGYYACPVCMSETECEHLHNSRKRCYMGHRRFLPANHKWRDEMKSFDGKKEHRCAPKQLSGEEILEQINSIEQVQFGKLFESTKNRKKCRKRKGQEAENSAENKSNWKKQSIFFELPYWKMLKVRHNLDVMHIEKNVCDNLLGTLLNIPGKTKDSKKARRDLMDKGLKPNLHLQGECEDMPCASYTLTHDQKKIFCEFLRYVKFPDGFASNISRCVKEKELAISGLKSHDCHVLLQRLLPLATRGYLEKDVYQVILEVSDFFRKLCSKTLYLDVLEKMEKQMALTLCKLERIFPPSFFDVMIHLMIHLASEAKIAGPVQYRWMYPFERKLGVFKRYVRNKAKPEASIAEQYIDNECMTFCSMYLNKVETRFNRMERNYDINDSLGNFSVFACKGRPFGGPKYVELSDSDLVKIHLFVLKNCDEIEDYRSELMLQLEIESQLNVDQRHDVQFPKWFKKRVEELQTEGLASEELISLANGPDSRVKLYSGCTVNGFRFHTKDRDSDKKTQNSGVVVEGEHDKKMIEFYGVIKEIIEVDYLRGGKRVLIFKCDWWSVKNALGIRKDRDSNILSVNICKTWYMDQPFILAYQARQIFYIQDLKLGKSWRIVEKIQPRSLYDFPKKIGAEPNDLEEPLQEEVPFPMIDIED